jgi:serine/threonine protein kinase
LDLLMRLIVIDTNRRISMEDVLRHPFFTASWGRNMDVTVVFQPLKWRKSQRIDNANTKSYQLQVYSGSHLNWSQE